MKVLLIDDHPLVLTALQAVIERLGDNVSVIGSATARAARDLLKRDTGFDLVLLDLQLGDANGFDVLAEFRSKYPALPVVVVSASDRASDVIRSIDLGAMGYVPKRASNDTLYEALHVVLSGGIYVPPMTMGSERPSPKLDGDTVPSVLQVEGEPMDLVGDGHRKPLPSFEALGLTPRQSDVFNLLLQGKPNKLIARELELSLDTVKGHVAAVLRALNVTSRTQAVLAVSQMGQEQVWPKPN